MTTKHVGRHRRPTPSLRTLTFAVSTGLTILVSPLLLAFAAILGALAQAGAL